MENGLLIKKREFENQGLGFEFWLFKVLKFKPSSKSDSFRIGIAAGPIPWSLRISLSENWAKIDRSVIPLFSRALLAGALNLDCQPICGFLSFSHSGHTGQSPVLLNWWPFGQVLSMGGFRVKTYCFSVQANIQFTPNLSTQLPK